MDISYRKEGTRRNGILFLYSLSPSLCVTSDADRRSSVIAKQPSLSPTAALEMDGLLFLYPSSLRNERYNGREYISKKENKQT